MQRLPGDSDVLGKAISPVVVATLTEKMPVESVALRDMWAKIARRLRVSGRASEVEKREVKFLQLHLGRGKDTKDLLMQTARERESMYCSLVCLGGGGGCAFVQLLSPPNESLEVFETQSVLFEQSLSEAARLTLIEGDP